MKKLLFYIIALPCLVLALDGCRKEEKVPDGGLAGIWAKAWKSEGFVETAGEDSDYGYNFGSSGSFGNKLSEAEECWYPVTCALSTEGKLNFNYSLSNCKCWSCTTEEYSACALLITRVDEKIYINRQSCMIKAPAIQYVV